MTDRMSAAELRAMQEQPKNQKYSAQRITVDGITFDSKRTDADYENFRQDVTRVMGVAS